MGFGLSELITKATGRLVSTLRGNWYFNNVATGRWWLPNPWDK